MNSEPYQPTDGDRLWLARAVAAEGPRELEVAQALVNRFMWLRSRRTSDLYPTLESFVRAYAQPVNPRWQPGGDRYEKARAAAVAANDADKARRLLDQARRRARASTRTQFPAEVARAVQRALRMGPVDLPTPSTTDYAAHWVVASHLTPTARPVKGVNRMWTVDSSWRGYRVHDGRLLPADGGTGRPSPLLVALSLLAAFLLLKGAG